MSFKCMLWASKARTGSATKKVILLLLADRANDEGMCFPSMDTIAYDCELTRECVSRNIKAMEEAGLLHVTKNSKSDGTWKNNVYHLHVTQDHMGHVIEDHVPCDSGSRDHVTDDHTNQSIEPIKQPIDRLFEDFWNLYPRKVGKGAARKSYEKALKKTTHDAIVISVMEHMDTDQWKRDNGQYIPHPSTWLNQERWLDEVKSGMPIVSGHNPSATV